MGEVPYRTVGVEVDVVEAEQHVAGVLRVARQQVAPAAHQQAEHGATQARVERPPRYPAVLRRRDGHSEREEHEEADQMPAGFR